MDRWRIGVVVVTAGACAMMAGRARADESSSGAVARTMVYDAESLRDPMASLLPQRTADRPASAQGAQAQAVTAPVPVPPKGMLQGMVWGTGGAPQAIIDGEVYRVGDMMKGTRIVAIDRQGVTVETQGTSFVLRPSPTITRPKRRAAK